MACISPDGKPTESGTKMLRALQAGPKSPEEIAGLVRLDWLSKRRISTSLPKREPS